jgi:hypothetical protein
MDRFQDLRPDVEVGGLDTPVPEPEVLAACET